MSELKAGGGPLQRAGGSSNGALWATTALTGEIDATSPPETFADLFAHEHANVAVDLSGVTFFTAAGIARLVDARNQLRSTGHDLVVRAPSRTVARVLTLCQMTDLIEAPENDGR
jgi:anti-anti-sigma factor